MRENYWMTCRVMATVAWVASAALIASSWAVMLLMEPYWKLAFLLGGTGVTMACIAGTLQVRSFNVRLCALVRAAHGMETREREAPGLHPIG